MNFFNFELFVANVKYVFSTCKAVKDIAYYSEEQTVRGESPTEFFVNRYCIFINRIILSCTVIFLIIKFDIALMLLATKT